MQVAFTIVVSHVGSLKMLVSLQQHLTQINLICPYKRKL